MIELSIIVPVYNVESHLPKCLESILNQTFRDFEVILIDDGSTDNSGVICDEYCKNDYRFKVVHQLNKGVSSARNVGLEIAEGKYLGFVDADDWIEPTMYEKMISIAKMKEYDVVICGLNYYSEQSELIRSVSFDQKVWYKNDLIFDLYGTPSKVTGACNNKILLRKKISNIRFSNKLHMAEDIVYLVNCFEHINSGYQISECYYNVLERLDSSTRKEKIDSMYRMIFEGKKALFSFALGHSKELSKVASVKYLDDCIRFSNLIKQEGKSNKTAFFKKFIVLRLEVIKQLPYMWFSGLISSKIAKRFLKESVMK